MTIDKLQQALTQFRDERNWAQFHTLRNLIISLNLEASELLELTQWKTCEEIESIPHHKETSKALRDECADILMYLLLIAEKSNFDLISAAQEKLEDNRAKYPIEKCYGSSTKYSKLS